MMILVSVGAVLSAATSRSAASGGTRETRSAGPSAAISVTARPTGTATRAAVAVNTSPCIAIPIRKAENSRLSSSAKPIPPTSPASVATAPTARASAAAIAATWRRRAPSALSRADSRVRCAMVMANVLWMLNAATSSATPPNAASTTRKPRRNPLSTALSPSST